MNFGSLVSRNRSTLNAWRLREAEWIEQTRVAGVPIAANATARLVQSSPQAGCCAALRQRCRLPACVTLSQLSMIGRITPAAGVPLGRVHK
jgi:hypothetical protein